jgi:hypothetical protein
MGIQSQIEFVLGKPCSPTSIYLKFINNDWWVDLDGSAGLISGEQEDWTYIRNAEKESISDWFSSVERLKKSYGFIFVHKRTGIGGMFFFEDNWKKIDWLININRPGATFCDRITDYTACLELVWPVFDDLGVSVEQLTCSQY